MELRALYPLILYGTVTYERYYGHDPYLFEGRMIHGSFDIQ